MAPNPKNVTNLETKSHKLRVLVAARRGGDLAISQLHTGSAALPSPDAVLDVNGLRLRETPPAPSSRGGCPPVCGDLLGETWYSIWYSI